MKRKQPQVILGKDALVGDELETLGSTRGTIDRLDRLPSGGRVAILSDGSALVLPNAVRVIVFR